MAHNEQVFTPNWVVSKMLDRIDYYPTFVSNNIIRKKHIIDNSCGEGAFLYEIVSRYIDACIYDNVSEEEIITELETYIHGIEIDYELCKKTHSKLLNLCKLKGIKAQQISFDIICADALKCKEYDNKMDYVVGNPPYCKVHDLKEKYDTVKQYKFAQDGMTDMYLVFFEVGLNMLKDKGVLVYITPNSWMTSVAGSNFRKYIKNTNCLFDIIQFGGYKVFDNATTFTNITILDKGKTDEYYYYSYEPNSDIVKEAKISDSFINDKFYIGSKEELNNLRKILNLSSIYHKIKVKNGFATLNDKLFVDTAPILNKELLENNDNVINIYKASTGKTYLGIYPYDKEGKPLNFNDLDDYSKSYLITKAKLLDVDTNKANWHLYGRYQGIKDMSKYRIAINNLVNDLASSIKIKLLKPYEGIYSGLYISCELEEHVEDYYEKIRNIIVSEDFIKYVQMLGKYKNGGYYTFSSKDLEKYVNYKFFNKS